MLIQPPIQWMRWALSPGVKQSLREAYHSPPSSVKDKKDRPYIFMGWCLINLAQVRLFLYLISRAKHWYNTSLFSYMYQFGEILMMYKGLDRVTVSNFFPVFPVFPQFVLDKPALTRQPEVVSREGNRITVLHAIISAASVCFQPVFCFLPFYLPLFLSAYSCLAIFSFLPFCEPITFLEAY